MYRLPNMASFAAFFHKFGLFVVELAFQFNLLIIGGDFNVPMNKMNKVNEPNTVRFLNLLAACGLR